MQMNSRLVTIAVFSDEEEQRIESLEFLGKFQLDCAKIDQKSLVSREEKPSNFQQALIKFTLL